MNRRVKWRRAVTVTYFYETGYIASPWRPPTKPIKAPKRFGATRRLSSCISRSWISLSIVWGYNFQYLFSCIISMNRKSYMVSYHFPGEGGNPWILLVLGNDEGGDVVLAFAILRGGVAAVVGWKIALSHALFAVGRARASEDRIHENLLLLERILNLRIP